MTTQMNKVVLIGDSIRMGYQEVVRRELAEVAEVWGPTQNGGNTQNVLDHLDEWVISQAPSVVHINCGLHDLKKDFGAAQAAIPVEPYEANVRDILQRLSHETTATIVWATTTPVNEQWHHATKGFDRFEADVAAYNQAATRVAKELGTLIDDLFAVIMDAGRDRCLRPDGVHFTDEGSALLGKAVAECIKRI